ncbi:hypothetical protein AB1Y20_013765 [Prymnesium parvum]|uniref:Magnesium transporter n=1 Tax=Prymnesium parvum TaxID=97485 RepID=A0AB34IGR6_PRYPA
MAGSPPGPPLLVLVPPNELQRYWWAGVLLSIGATFASTLGKELFRLASVKELSVNDKGGLMLSATLNLSRLPSCVLSLPAWLLRLAAASCTLGLAPLLQLFAFAFDAMPVVSALSALVLLWNLLLAQSLLGELCTTARALPAALIALGAFGAGVSGSSLAAQLTSDGWGQVLTRGLAAAYYLMLTCVVLGMCYLTSKQHRPSTKSSLKAALGGVIAGGTVFISKGSLELTKCALFTTTCEDQPLKHEAIYVVLPVTFLLQSLAIYILADALRRSEAMVSVAIYEGTLLITAATAGSLVLVESAAGMSAGQAVAYAASLVTILVGLVLLLRWPALLGDGDALAVTAFQQQLGRWTGSSNAKPNEASKLVVNRSELVGASAAPANGSSC